MSHVRLLTHIVISTKHREMSIGADYAPRLHQYLTGIVKNHRCELIDINGIPNHIHMLIDLSPTVALSDLMRNLKHSSSEWAKECGCFPAFKGWGDGYFAASVSAIHKERVIKYIDQQQEHHANTRFEDEYERLILKNGLTLYKFPD